MPEWLSSPMIVGLVGVGGVWLGSWLTYRREQTSRQLEFLRRQVEDFYSPMLGLRREIQAKSSLRAEISEVAGAAWTELCRDDLPPDAVRALEEARWPAFERIMKYNNDQLTGELLPAYRNMLSLFRENLWLAEETTSRYYRDLVNFVEIWNRFEAGSIPREVLHRLKHSEDSLKPLYEDLGGTLFRLRSKLSTGRP